jgi:hypothetical protein
MNNRRRDVVNNPEAYSDRHMEKWALDSGLHSYEFWFPCNNT